MDNSYRFHSPILSCLLIIILTMTTATAQTFEPTYQSLEQHETPEWFHDAKLGIFIHWGIYSVPAWAERGEYAEWYPNRIQNEGSPDHEYHVETYGEDFRYEDFIPMWKAGNWDPDEWAELFREAGARYVIPVGEHHDGFPLWDSELTDWNAAQMGPERDLIGELAEAVRAREMKYAPSYHGLLNYYTPEYSGPHPEYLNENYVEFMHGKLRELIDKYQPDLLWLDGDWQEPVETFRTKEIIAYYYNQAEQWDKEVAVNDRWGQVRGIFGDFYTQEYEYDVIDRLIDHKWENTRGMGHSFGYNRNELPEDYLTVTELVHMLVDNVSKNANLLLNVGPKADGTIPEIQKNLLLGLGEWLELNGEAIYGTRPWVTSETTASNGSRVRFTWKEDEEILYAFLMEADESGEITIHSVMPEEDTEVRMVGTGEALEWDQQGKDLIIHLPEMLPGDHGYAVSIRPEPGFYMTKGR